MHCNLRPQEPCQPFHALITMPCQVWSCWTYPLPYYSIFAAHTLHCDLEHLQHIACDVMKLCTKFECNRAIRGGVIASSVFDHMTLNIALRVALGCGIIFTKFDLRQLAWIISAFWCWYVTLRHAVTLTFDPLTLKVCDTLSVMRSKFVQNLCEIEQPTAELLIILRISAHVMSHCDPDLWPLDLELLQHFGCPVFKLCT